MSVNAMGPRGIRAKKGDKKKEKQIFHEERLMKRMAELETRRR
jgi:hypothetical protein